MSTLAITGSSGRLGGRVARALAGAGVPQRLVVRDPSRAPRLAGAEVAQASYGDGDAARRALAGLEVVLMVSGSEAPDRLEQHLTFVDAAADAGVSHLVYVSILGASPHSVFTLARDHWATEERIRELGMTFTFLRDSFYADDLAAFAGPDGVIRGPAGEGRLSLVSIDDVAEVATAVLREPSRHRDVAYSVTGPEALTLDDIAAELTAATGRAHSYVRESVEEAYASRAVFGAPDWQVDAWVSTYTAMAAGELDEVSTAVRDITGHGATSFADFLRG